MLRNWLMVLGLGAAGCGSEATIEPGGDSGSSDPQGLCPDRSDDIVLVEPDAGATTLAVGAPIIIDWFGDIPDRTTSMRTGEDYVTTKDHEEIFPAKPGDPRRSVITYELITGNEYHFEAGWTCIKGGYIDFTVVTLDFTAVDAP